MLFASHKLSFCRRAILVSRVVITRSTILVVDLLEELSRVSKKEEVDQGPSCTYFCWPMVPGRCLGPMSVVNAIEV